MTNMEKIYTEVLDFKLKVLNLGEQTSNMTFNNKDISLLNTCNVYAFYSYDGNSYEEILDLFNVEDDIVTFRTQTIDTFFVNGKTKSTKETVDFVTVPIEEFIVLLGDYQIALPTTKNAMDYFKKI